MFEVPYRKTGKMLNKQMYFSSDHLEKFHLLRSEVSLTRIRICIRMDPHWFVPLDLDPDLDPR
jgi:hypothetical protein